MNCEMALTTSARMVGPRRAAKFRTVSCERRTAKFLGGPASPRNVAEFMTTQHSKRYDFKELGEPRSYGERGFLSFLPSPRQTAGRAKLVKTRARDPLEAGSQLHTISRVQVPRGVSL